MSDKKLSAWQKHLKSFAKKHKGESFGKNGFVKAASAEYKKKACKKSKKPRAPLSDAQKKKMKDGRSAAKLERRKACGKDILRKCTVEDLKKKVRRLNKKIVEGGGKPIRLGQNKEGLIRALYYNKWYN